MTLKEARGEIFYSYYIMVNMNLGKKARHTASITNRTSIFGIMGGTIQSGGYRNSIRSATYRATTYNKIPPRPTPGKQYMLAHNLLSRNPQCSGGVGRMHTHPGACGPCNCEGGGDGRGAPHGGSTGKYVWSEGDSIDVTLYDCGYASGNNYWKTKTDETGAKAIGGYDGVEDDGSSEIMTITFTFMSEGVGMQKDWLDALNSKEVTEGMVATGVKDVLLDRGGVWAELVPASCACKGMTTTNTACCLGEYFHTTPDDDRVKCEAGESDGVESTAKYCSLTLGHIFHFDIWSKGGEDYLLISAGADEKHPSFGQTIGGSISYPDTTKSRDNMASYLSCDDKIPEPQEEGIRFELFNPSDGLVKQFGFDSSSSSIKSYWPWGPTAGDAYDIFSGTGMKSGLVQVGEAVAYDMMVALSPEPSQGGGSDA